MARFILVLGHSGTGKTTAWRNIPPHEAMVFTPNTKQLAFRGSNKMYTPLDPSTGMGNLLTMHNLDDIKNNLIWANNAAHIKYILVEDFSHFVNNYVLGQAFLAKAATKESFSRWTDFGAIILELFAGEYTKALREDLTIVVNHHTQTEMSGKEVFKTSGKLMSDAIDPVSYFTYIFHSRCIPDGTTGRRKYVFNTNEDGTHLAKSPMGLFAPEELEVENDLLPIIQRIEAYENE